MPTCFSYSSAWDWSFACFSLMSARKEPWSFSFCKLLAWKCWISAPICRLTNGTDICHLTALLIKHKNEWLKEQIKQENKYPPGWFLPSGHRLHCFGHLQNWTVQIFGLQLQIETERDSFLPDNRLTLLKTSEFINISFKACLAQCRGHQSIQALKRMYNKYHEQTYRG